MQQKAKNQSPLHFSLKSQLITLPQQNNLGRKSKKIKILPSSTRKLQEQTIEQIHQQLNRYINTVDVRVKEIVQNYQAQLLVAYRSYMKKTKLEMQQIKKIAASNSHGDKNFQEKIDILEKQLIIFREQSLKLFKNSFKKDQEISNQSLQIKMLKKENKDYQQRLYNLMKKNKELEVQLLIIKNQKQNKSADKRSYPSSPHTLVEIDRVLSASVKNKLQENPLFNKTNYLKMGKTSTFTRNQTLKDQQKCSHSINNDKTCNPLNNDDSKNYKTRQKMIQKHSKQKLSNYRKMTCNIVSKMNKKKQSYIGQQIIKKSNQLAQKTCLINIFRQAVQRIHHDIVKKKNIPSLKVFRANGPLDFYQFKKIDSYALFELLFTNEVLLQHIYNIIFNQK